MAWHSDNACKQPLFTNCSYTVYMVTPKRSLYLISLPHLQRLLRHLPHILRSLPGNPCLEMCFPCMLLDNLCNEVQEGFSLAFLVYVHSYTLHAIRASLEFVAKTLVPIQAL